jgi:protein tyrosine/serine phosphatase
VPRALNYLFGFLIAGLLVGGPAGFICYQQSQIRNFRVVREGVLYRSGQTSLGGLKRIIHDYGIRTVVTLRDAARVGDLPPDWEEEAYCKAQDIAYYRITPRNWWAPDGSVPAEEGVRTFVQVMKNPDNFPVLIHCFAGVHRTGAFCAIYRMEFEHWSNTAAIAEMKSCGYFNLDDELDILNYLEHYRPAWQSPPGSTTDSATKPAEIHFSRRVKQRGKKALGS